MRASKCLALLVYLALEPPTRGREVHRAIALSLEAVTPEGAMGDVAGEVARHADKAQERGVTFRYALLASEEAIHRYAMDEALAWLDLAAGAADDETQADLVNRRTADLLGRAGWSEPPRRVSRLGTPARGLAQIDLDLG